MYDKRNAVVNRILDERKRKSQFTVKTRQNLAHLLPLRLHLPLRLPHRLPHHRTNDATLERPTQSQPQPVRAEAPQQKGQKQANHDGDAVAETFVGDLRPVDPGKHFREILVLVAT